VIVLDRAILREVITMAPKAPGNRPFMGVTEVARILGYSRATIYEHIKKGILPATKINNTTRIPRGAFNEWLAAQNTAAMANVEQ